MSSELHPIVAEPAPQPSSSKRKIYEVEFDTLPQEAVEGLIRKDVEYISSILGVEVC